jgi:hypothetical protein
MFTILDASKALPQDFKIVISTLRAVRDDLTDVMESEVSEWLAEVKADVINWEIFGYEPEWSELRDRLNEICSDDGMPPLFGD